jgi:hypothetical protein
VAVVGHGRHVDAEADGLVPADAEGGQLHFRPANE